MKNSYDNFFNFLTYFLFTILIAIVIYNTYINIIYKKPLSNSSPPRNSISVSPITGEVIQDVDATPTLINVIYESQTITDLYQITKADIVFEQYDAYLGVINYSAVFYNKNVSTESSIKSISTISLNDLPKINFIDPPELDTYNFTHDVDTIYIPYDDYNQTSFIFQNGIYYHFTKNIIDVHKITNTPLGFSNIIIEFISSSKDASRSGLLFAGGKLQRLIIDDTGIKMLNNHKELDLSLIRGSTLWIKCTNTTKVITSNDNLES